MHYKLEYFNYTLHCNELVEVFCHYFYLSTDQI